ncbi:MAG: helix-turn-helix domain-containing protein [Acidobacteriaceae bacterium]|nr:helix-turn-helix domain-containing protein [Acidobacteriaceae bacterium]
MAQPQAVFAQPELPTFEPFVDEHVLAQYLQLTSRRVLEMARRGELPAHPIGKTRKTWRFRLSEIDVHFSRTADRQRSATIALAVPGTQERKNLG